MARKKEETRERGLYKNGLRWWVRSVRSPLTSIARSLSTGTTDLATANRIARMLRDLAENRAQWEWLDRAVSGDVSLTQLYTNFASGSLHTLRSAIEQRAAVVDDPDLSPWVAKWDAEHQMARVAAGEITQERRELTLRYVRAFIPEGVVFPRSRFTEEVIKAQMAAIRHPRTGATPAGATLRKYVDALQLFYKYAKKAHRANLTVNPFEDADWVPANSDPRSTVWDWAVAMQVLEKMWLTDRRACMALVLGSGIELGAALALKWKDVGPGGNDEGRWVIAHATTSGKNAAREQRKIFVRKWAWDRFIDARPEDAAPTARCWYSINPVNRGRDIRDAFYEAQVAAGLIESPAVSKATGKRAWKAVNPHTIHDARHTYCAIALLGLDGERRISIKEASRQLGHGDETMVMKIYSKLNIEQQLRLVELREAREQGKQQAAADAAGGV